MLDALMQERPPLSAIDPTIRSRYFSPVVNVIGANHDFAEARTMNLDPRILAPKAGGTGVAEKYASLALS